MYDITARNYIFLNYVDNPYHKKIVKKQRPKYTRIKLLSRDFVTSEKKTQKFTRCSGYAVW